MFALITGKLGGADMFCLKNRKTECRGFTLAELLIVVAIIAVLVAVSIPIFNTQLKKASLATCEANRRSLKADLSAIYLNNLNADDVKTEYDLVKDNYTCPDGGIISYKLDEATGVITMSCSKHSDTGELIDIESSLKALGKATGNKAIADFYKNNDNKLPTLSSDQSFWKKLFGDAKLKNDPETLYWRPSSVTVNGKTEYIMYASAEDYPVNESANHSQWKGYACYYNGTYYVSNNKAYGGKNDTGSVATGTTNYSDEYLEKWLEEKGWVAVSTQ